MSDEVDLVELGVILWKRRKLIVAVFLVCIAGAVLLSFIFPRTYKYSTVVGIGSYLAPDGSMMRYVSAGNAVLELNDGIIQMAVKKYLVSHTIDPSEIKIVASASPTSEVGLIDIITIGGNAPKSLGSAFTTIERSITARFTKSVLDQNKVLIAGDSQPITIIVPPSRSPLPLGLTRVAIISMGAVLGIVFSLLAAGCANYVSAVRRRLMVKVG